MPFIAGTRGAMSTSTLRPGPSPQTDVSEDELFELLSSRRRRYVIHALQRAEQHLEIGTLSERVAAWEWEQSAEDVSHDQRKSVYTSLQQHHLPKMDEVGVVEYDKDRGTIEPTDTLDEVRLYLEVVQGGEMPWSEFYLGYGALSVVVLLTVSLNVYPMVMLSELAWLGLLSLGLLAAALAHHFDDRRSLLGVGEPPKADD